MGIARNDIGETCLAAAFDSEVPQECSQAGCQLLDGSTPALARAVHEVAANISRTPVGRVRSKCRHQAVGITSVELDGRIGRTAMLAQPQDIGIIDDHQYILFRKQISFNRWNKNEPLDDKIPLEQTQWLLKCWRLLTEKRLVREAGLEDELGFSLDLVARLFGHESFQPVPFALLPSRVR
jgi:hypothetical protein